MRFDDILREVQRTLREAGLGPGQATEDRILRTTLEVMRRSLDAETSTPQEWPGLGRFKPRPLASTDGSARWLFEPAAPDRLLQLWRKALRSVERPLIHPEHRFVVLFSAKSACSTVVIWFLHTLGLAEDARRFSEWPHDYRIERFYQQPDYLQARDAWGPDDVTVLRVVRDPIERAASSFRHALGTGYARELVLDRLGIDTHRDGLSFERFIDFLTLEDLSRCNPHHKRQKHALEELRQADVVINVTESDLFAGLNAFEQRLGLPLTDFGALGWVNELQATRVPHSVDVNDDAYRLVLTREHAQRGPWPKGLITAEARARLEVLYREDVALYTPTS